MTLLHHSYSTNGVRPSAVQTGSGETDAPVKQFCAYWQRFKMASDGTLEVEKLANVVQRKTNTVVRLNGEIVPLRPR